VFDFRERPDLALLSVEDLLCIRAAMELRRIMLLASCIFGVATNAWSTQSVARVWDEQTLSAIRIDVPNPPVHARNLFHMSVAMYDAWAAYDQVAVGYLYHEKPTAADITAARNEAISFAAYRILRERYLLSRNAATTVAALDAQMTALGYDMNNLSQDTSTPAGVGNKVAAMVSAFFMQDGALQTRFYQDYPPAQGGYAPVNAPLDVTLSGGVTLDVNHWQPLKNTNAVLQNGIPGPVIQSFVGSQWLNVRPFALMRDDATQPWINPGPQPRLGGVGDQQFRDEVVDIIRRSSEMTPDDGVLIDISPGVFGNNTLGANDGTGHSLNPVTGLPYETNLVPRGDFARVLAEFWADGPSSETPPGHWNVMANRVSDNPLTVKSIGGSGPVVDDLEWDVKLYFALNAAVHDAACAAWSLKRFYDGGRPIESIRYMGQRGQSTDLGDPSYDPEGLPLVPGLIELVTTNSSQPGERHEGLAVGKIAIHAWGGQPLDVTNQHTGIKWMLAADWMPYQKNTFVTPAFPGFVSGHSSFSRAAAEVLAAFTGSAFFPGGMGTYTAHINSLTFEQGPSQEIQLQWGTYFDASDQAGLSRLWGGIHVSADDLAGRRVGAQCGQGDWALAQKYFNGSILQAPVTMTIRPANPAGCEIRFNTLRGLYYKLQSSEDILGPFTDDIFGYSQAVDSSMLRVDNPMGTRKFYRVVGTLSP
jgi:hypothetical protein